MKNKSLHSNLYSYHNAVEQHISQEGKKTEERKQKHTHPQTNIAQIDFQDLTDRKQNM